MQKGGSPQYGTKTLKDIEEYDFVIIPCISDFRNTDQFSVIVVTPTLKKFTYLSPDPAQSAAPVHVQQYFQFVLAHLGADDFTDQVFPEVTRQGHSADSGALVAAYVECFARCKTLNSFTLADMRAMRYRMAHVLTQGFPA